jgi:molybdopterin/thiamine biosynthesis adenylyltransferase
LNDLDRTSIAVVGAGAIGSAAVAQLAAAGVGRLGIVDPKGSEPDRDHSALAEATATGAGALNPRGIAEPYPARIEAANVEAILSGFDLAIDCANDDAVHLLLNDSCAAAGLPLVIGGASGARVWATAFVQGAPCYRCASPPPTSEPAAAAAGAALGAMLAADALKLAAGMPAALAGKLLELDLDAGTATVGPVRRRAGCPSCAQSAVEAAL